MNTKPKKKRRIWIPIVVVLAVLLAIAALVPVVAPAVGKWFTSQETAIRDGWAVDVGDLIGVEEEHQIEIRTASADASITVLQLVPTDIDQEGFTYYDTAVQQRIRAVLDKGQTTQNLNWTAETPLAVLNPFGTGANGLYLYFETDFPTQVEYTIRVEDERIPDFTAVAADSSGREYSTRHEFQMIGLVPGEVNEVTMTLRGSWGNVRQTVRFTIEMPEPYSGYDTVLEVTDGTSTEPLDEGLFTMMRTNGHLGYGFLFDNAGVMRYEMVLEGFGMDRILTYGDEIVTCVSANKLARINGLGEVEQVYPLGEYELHHDINYGRDGTVVALVEQTGAVDVEDLVVEVDLASGEVDLLLDFKDLMADYHSQTRPIGATDPFFWQAGEQDWIHLNTIQYLPDSDSLVVSSRETSTAIKVGDVHGQAAIDWFCGSVRPAQRRIRPRGRRRGVLPADVQQQLLGSVLPQRRLPARPARHGQHRDVRRERGRQLQLHLPHRRKRRHGGAGGLLPGALFQHRVQRHPRPGHRALGGQQRRGHGVWRIRQPGQFDPPVCLRVHHAGLPHLQVRL